MSDLTARLAQLSPTKRAALEAMLLEREQSRAASLRIQPAAADERATLSFAEQRLWFLDQLEPGHPFYNMPLAARLTGPLDRPAFAQGLQAVIDRHESLRHGYRKEGGEPVRTIHQSAEVTPQWVDLRTTSRRAESVSSRSSETKHSDAKLQQLIREESRRPFNLDQPPLLRCVVYQLADEECVVLLVMHHIVSDGWSMWVMLNELSTCYQAALAGPNCQTTLLPLGIQYADYAVWQRGQCDEERMQAAIEFWRTQLADTPPLLELPTDRPRGASQDFDGGVFEFALSAETCAQLRTFADTHNATPFVILMAAYQAWLARHTGQTDLCVGTVVAGRDRAELERLIGFFVNTLAIRTDVADDPTFGDLVQRVKETSLAAFSHSGAPFDKIIETVAPERQQSHAALFQTALVVQNPPRDFGQAAELTVEPMLVDNGTAKYDLTFFFWEEGEAADRRWTGSAEYRSELFDRATIERFAASLQTLLADALATPTKLISQLAVLDKASQQAIARWNDTDAPLPEPLLVHQNIERHAAELPEKIAIRHGTQAISYRELNERANRVAAALKSRGVVLDTPVVVCLPRCVDGITAMLGIWKAGGVYVPVAPEQAPQRLPGVLEDTGATIVLTHDGKNNAINNAKIESPSSIDCTSVSTLLESNKANFQALTDQSPTSRCYVIFTSGSTGRPKGVEVEHHSVVNFFRAQTALMQVTAADLVMHAFNPSFDGGVSEVLLGLSNGATLVIADAETILDPNLFTKFLLNSNVTVAKFPPALLATLDPQKLADLKTVLTAGDTLTGALAARWATDGRMMLNGYGPTEATIGVSIHPLTPPVPAKPPIGRPMTNMRAYVLDTNDQMTPIGVPGEIVIGGRGIARGYLNRPAETTAKFVPDPFSTTDGARMYRTGDIGRWNPDGVLEFLGRVDDQVQLRGYRVEPGEVTAALERLPQVDAAVVMAQPDGRGESQLVAYVVPKRDDQPAKTIDQPIETDEQQHLTAWQALMDQKHQSAGAIRDPEFDITGWISSFTGQLIPKEEMRAWADAAAQRILSLAPNRVLEIGCGTGLILSRVAPQCESYVGTDFLGRSLQQLQGVLDRTETLRDKVELFEQAAHQLGSLAGKQFDTIILNSVVQYFPSIDYLLDVLRLAESLLSPGGKIFLGDLRDLRLLEPMAAAIEITRAEPGLAHRELLGRIEASLRREEELLVDPRLFAQLKPILPRLSTSSSQLKPGEAENELIRFRYDAVLRFDSPASDNEMLELSPGKPDEVIAKFLEADAPVGVVTGSANPRVSRDVAVWQSLRELGEGAELESLRTMLAEPIDKLATPDDWQRAAAEHDLVSEIRCGNNVDGFEVVLAREASALMQSGTLAKLVNSPAKLSPEVDFSSFANRPLEEKLAARLVPQLRAALAEQLPTYMIPSAFVMLDEFPRNSNGKIDRDALPPPPAGRPAWASGYVAPQDEHGRLVAQVWEELLGVSPVGLDDNFFELGGHSMLAVQVMAEIETRSGQALPLSALFQEPTVRRLAELLANPEAIDAASSLIPLQPTGDKPPLFCIHPAGGTVFCYQALAAHFANERPVIGIQAAGVDGRQVPHESMDEMATHYANLIRQHTPHGPYHLCGWSLGGNIAYAVAQQLASAGENASVEIGVVALFDTGAIPPEEDLSEEDLLPLLAALFPDTEHLPLEELRQLDAEAQVAYFTERATQAGLVDANQLDASRHVFNVFQKNIQVVHQHRATKYDGPITLFRAGEQTKTSELSDDPQLGWGDLVTGVTVHQVPSDHNRMMNSPQVDALVVMLRKSLSEFESRG